MFYHNMLILLLSLPAEIDLANLNGQVMNLPHHKSTPASDRLRQREEYILISISRKKFDFFLRDMTTYFIQSLVFVSLDVICPKNACLETQCLVNVEVKVRAAMKKKKHPCQHCLTNSKHDVWIETRMSEKMPNYIPLKHASVCYVCGEQITN